MDPRSPLFRRMALGLQAVAFLYSCVSLFRPVWLLVETFNDDAAYFLTIARNCAGGHGWTFDRIHPTNGFQPLWEYLLVGLCTLQPGPPELQIRWIGAIESALLSASIFVLWRLVDRHFGSRAGASLAVAFVALYYFPTRSGMETSLVTLLVSLVLTVAVEGRPWSGRSLLPAAGFGLLLGALMLARLDSVFLAGSVMGMVLIEAVRSGDTARRGAWSRAALSGVVAAGVVLPYLAYNLSAFGHVMPISGAVKSSFPVPGWHYPAFGLTRLQRAFFLASTAVALGTLVWRLGAGRAGGSALARCGLAALSLGVLLHHLYAVLFMKWAVLGWHFALGRVLTLMVAAILAERALGRLSSRAAARVWAVAALLLLFGAGAAVHRRDWEAVSKPSWRRMSYDTAIWVRDSLPADAILAMKDSGHMGLFSERRVVNLDGIVNNFDYQERMRRGEFAAYVRETGIDCIVYGPPPRPYGSFRFCSASNLYNAHGGCIDLYEADEVHRTPDFWTPQGRLAMVVCRVRE